MLSIQTSFCKTIKELILVVNCTFPNGTYYFYSLKTLFTAPKILR